MLDMTDSKALEAIQAFAAGKIDRIKVRGLLGLSEPIPPCEGLTDEQRAPFFTPEHMVLLRATHYLNENHACYLVTKITQNDNGTFCVEVGFMNEKNWNNSSPRGYLTVSAAFEVFDVSYLKGDCVMIDE